MIARAILADPRDLAVHWVWLPLFHYRRCRSSRSAGRCRTCAGRTSPSRRRSPSSSSATSGARQPRRRRCPRRRRRSSRRSRGRVPHRDADGDDRRSPSRSSRCSCWGSPSPSSGGATGRGGHARRGGAAPLRGVGHLRDRRGPHGRRAVATRRCPGAARPPRAPRRPPGRRAVDRRGRAGRPHPRVGALRAAGRREVVGFLRADARVREPGGRRRRRFWRRPASRAMRSTTRSTSRCGSSVPRVALAPFGIARTWRAPRRAVRAQQYVLVLEGVTT